MPESKDAENSRIPAFAGMAKNGGRPILGQPQPAAAPTIVHWRLALTCDDHGGKSKTYVQLKLHVLMLDAGLVAYQRRKRGREGSDRGCALELSRPSLFDAGDA
jgi:hypothetical protein